MSATLTSPSQPTLNQRRAGTAPWRGGAVLGLLLIFVAGYLLAGVLQNRPDRDAEEAATAERVQVPVGLSPSLGPDDAPVTIVEFADFQCGFCARSARLQDRVLAEYPRTVRWVFKQFPLDFHSDARRAARAALAAQRQGQFWAYHHRLFADQRHLSESDLLSLARELGLDLVRFRSDLADQALERQVTEDIELGRKVGVKGTPTYFVNGRRFEGTLPYSKLERLVGEEVALAAERLRQGVPRDQLYQALTQPAGQPAAKPAASRPAGS